MSILLPSDPNLIYKDDGHTYWYDHHSYQEQLHSATNVIGQFQKPFNFNIISQRHAAKHDIPVETVRRRWKYANKKATEIGNIVHEIAEFMFKGQEEFRDWEFIKNNYRVTLSENNKFIDSLKVYFHFLLSKYYEFKLHGYGVFPELRLCSPEDGIAGTSDLPITLDDSTVKVIDFKTNQLEVKGKEFTKGKGYLLEPFNELTDSKENIYVMQLHLYGYMIEKSYNMKVDELEIYHFDNGKVHIYTYAYENDFANKIVSSFKERITNESING